ncbi:P-loop containing nucleoside triphosphate hydrolase protein [Protomyces lactucae-debilis]|uniref:Vesicular-fusion protein SEC18 n=1 Tax=Protomyces lactucae-debilis TaxID=2754530 RepID=A0A1Y2F991_PROLT|nr:P-loop containing nucleoside triphosphate hydrolase protein [Protomyces lactucae-debilis]ORY79906.1 P-loop containing nucleoside triphosphate hydrolase protein [Protomyces lactucae-debilis]
MTSRFPANPFAPSPRKQESIPTRQAPPAQQQGRPVPQPQDRAYSTQQPRGYTVAGLPAGGGNALALRNVVCVHPADFGNIGYLLLNNQQALAVQPDEHVTPGQIGFGVAQREWCRLAVGDQVTVTPWDPYSQGEKALVYIGSMDLEVGFYSKNRTTEEAFDPEELQKQLCRNYEHQPFAPGQLLVVDFKSYMIKACVKAVTLTSYAVASEEAAASSDHPGTRGILTRDSQIEFFRSGTLPIQLKASTRRAPANAIIQPSFKFENMGIGGLDNEFSSIFRRAFASRVLPLGIVQRMGLQHVKGILMYGPPGTGKTLMARQIGKMLNANEPKIVNGPEILNKFVGQSEENIRKLFADAEKEYKEKGDESSLHIIIFDELDAICKQRGSTGGGTGVGDSVVNQLLSKMDGVDQLNNILIIGMTNRLDMIDEALLRPGRLEVHVEISLPDTHGRSQILKIHTNHMRTSGSLAGDVDVEELAALTKNFSGAELSGLVRSASSFAMNSYVKGGTVAAFEKGIEDMQVRREDFMHALDEVRPAFGVSEEELSSVVQSGILHYSPQIGEILKEGQLFINQVRKSERTPLVSVLLYGPAGAGKSALAATLAMQSDFGFIKLISPESMIGMNEAQKVNCLNKVFTDSNKSQLSCIVVDNIERIIDWVPIGPRFSNTVLQALMVLMQRKPPKGRRLLVLATSSERSVLDQLGLLNTIDSEIPIPEVADLQQLGQLVGELGLFANERSLRDALGNLQQLVGGSQVGVGVKRVLMIGEAAAQDEDVAGRFVDLMAKSIAENGTRQASM